MTRNGARIPIHGSPGYVGTPSCMDFPFVDGQGFREVKGSTAVHGNSYIQTFAWDEDGPRAEAVLSYSQSTNPASPHYADQTWLYSEQRRHPLPFSEDEIRSDPALETVVLVK